MCEFKSGIVLKDRVFCPLDYDSHEDMLKELKLTDKDDKPKFVRVEIVPIDGNIFNHDLKNWKLKVDQDYKPDWFSEKFAEKEMKEALQEVFKERFVVKGKIDRIEKGRWFLGGYAQVKYICDSAQVKNICGSAQVKYICGSAQVENIYGSAQVENICGSAQVENIYGSAQVENICDSAQVKYIYGSAQVKYIYGSAQVENIYGSAQVKNICGSAQVKNICGSAQVENICDSAQVKYIYGRSVCCFTQESAKYKTIKENGVVILYYKDNPEIVVANKNIKLTIV